MRRDVFIVKKLISKVVLGGILLASTKAYADAPAPKWYDTLAISGYTQGSYVYNIEQPQQAGITHTNAARIFDVESNSFNINAFHLQIAKPMGDDNYAFTTKLHTGRDARVIHSVGTDAVGTVNFDVEEAYMTLAVPSLKKLTFTGGKFVTLEGVEVIESPMNPNFSEGYLFGFAEPFTHTGVKANYAFTDQFNATFGVVNGWDQAAALHDGKTIIWQLAMAPSKMFNNSLQGSYGADGTTDNSSKLLSVDYVANATVTDKLSLWGQLNWGQTTNILLAGTPPVVPAYPGTVGPSTVRWMGAGLWATYAFTSLYSEALRYEVFQDDHGANHTGLGNVTLQEITWTHKFQWTKALATRLEFRHDWSNSGLVFPAHNAGGVTGTTRAVQDTISADWVVTF